MWGAYRKETQRFIIKKLRLEAGNGAGVGSLFFEEYVLCLKKPR